MKMVPLSKRDNLFYLDKCHLKIKDGNVYSFCKKGKTSIPPESIGGIVLGPGVNITSAAIKALSKGKVNIFFSGPNGLPVYSKIVQYRNNYHKLKQYEIVKNKELNLKYAILFLNLRNKAIEKYYSKLPLIKEINKVTKVEELRALEARWTKHIYKTFLKQSKAQIDENTYFTLLNSYLYNLASVVIAHKGLDDNLGIIHGVTGGGGLSFDLADIYKSIISLQYCIESCEENPFDWIHKKINEYKIREGYSKICDEIKKVNLEWLS